jgi:hypothetical protein
MLDLSRTNGMRATAIGLLTLGFAFSTPARSEGPAPGDAWKSSPFHGLTDGATGKAIPCLCRFRGRDFRLGDSVCMQTPIGVVIARCDLLLNNTTWAPTNEPCTLSWRSGKGLPFL